MALALVRPCEFTPSATTKTRCSLCHLVAVPQANGQSICEWASASGGSLSVVSGCRALASRLVKIDDVALKKHKDLSHCLFRHPSLFNPPDLQPSHHRPSAPTTNMKLYQIFCMLGLSIVALAEQTESICGATCGVGSDDPTGNELLIRCGICGTSA